MDELQEWAEGLKAQLRVVGDDDAVQEGFVRMIGRRRPHDLRNPQGYWYRASVSAIRDRQRRRMSEERAIRLWLEVRPRSGEDEDWSEEQISSLRRGIAELHGKRRRLIELELSGVRHSRGLADALGLSEGATRVLRHRTYRQLRALVAELPVPT